jgi:hypothetical protein
MANDAQARLTIGPAQWGPDAERLLPAALAGATLADLRNQVENGAQLFHICAGAAVVVALVLRVDHTATGSEGVIVAASGGLAGVDLVASCMPAIEAQFSGVSRYRIHTARPGLVRKLAKQGYGPREIVCYKEKQ